MNPSRARRGPVFDIAYTVLAAHPAYRSFEETGDRREFSRLLDSIAGELVAAGLPADDVHFAKRYPQSEERFVEQSLGRLAEAGMLPHTEYRRDCYAEIAADMREHHEHGPFRTYIYPEEARLLFAIADIVHPVSAIFLGSYYGYWAHAAIWTIARHGGRTVLVDPDPRAQEIARRNLERAGLLEHVELAISTGESYLGESSLGGPEGTYDFVVLDAEGPRDHPDPEQRGKCVYAPLLRHALPHMTSNGLLACHNILFQDIAECSYFDGIIGRNLTELGPFMTLVANQFREFVECTSTEGVGVGRRGQSAKA